MHKVEEATELHVVTPNEPGILGRVLGTLANAGINLKALCVYTHENQGHFLLITADNKKAEKALRSLGYKVKTNKVVLWDYIEPLLHALRVAGFAAWLHEYGELYADSPIHIHAVAIGDWELSVAANDQLTGAAGYFRGYNGLPVPVGESPTPDRYGGPILCQWMIDLGYPDLR